MSTRIVYRSRRNFSSETGVHFSYNDYIDEHAWQLLPESERLSFRKEKHDGEIKDLNRALTRAQDPATKTNTFYKRVLDKNIESSHYQLMVYFAHSRMVTYKKSIIAEETMKPREFIDANRSVCDRVFEEADKMFFYQLSDDQMFMAADVFLKAKFHPEAIEGGEPYTIPT